MSNDEIPIDNTSVTDQGTSGQSDSNGELLRIVGAKVLLDDGLQTTDVLIEGTHIVAVGLDWSTYNRNLPNRTIDASGLILAPALIDVHGDAFERQLMPRPGVGFPVEAALLETDRQLAANGIATAYHALTLSWEPGLRSVAMAEQIMDALTHLENRLTVDNRVQLRWESFAFEACELVTQTITRSSKPPTLAFNDHTSMVMLHPDMAVQDRPFEQRDDFPLTDIQSDYFASKIKDQSSRSGLSVSEFITLFEKVWARRSQIPETISAMAELAREHGIAMFSHDDTQIETRNYYRSLGAKVAEFPMQVAVGESARSQNDLIVFGAPNVVRGKSHLGSPSATDMISSGLCDVLASDYFYPSLLTAISQLVNTQGFALHEVWPLVSANAAKAVGLADRGSIAPNMQADLVLIDWPENQMPAIRQTFSAGRIAYASMPHK